MVVNCDRDTEAYLDAMNEFENLWNQTYELSQDRIKDYSTKLSFAIERWDMDYDMANSDIKPNYMQRKALRELNRYRAIGQERALVISATGSGKTYLAAFDTLNFNPDRLLYIVHEGSILKKSLETFQRYLVALKLAACIMRKQRKQKKIFCFLPMYLCVAHSNSLIRRNSIISSSMSVIMLLRTVIGNHRLFEPEFLLGLTATENRMDNQDVVEILAIISHTSCDFVMPSSMI